MTRKAFIKGFIITLITSLLINLIFMLLIGRSMEFKDELETYPKEFHSLTYEEKVAWEKDNVIYTTGFSVLKKIVNHSPTRYRMLENFVIIFAMLFPIIWGFGEMFRETDEP